MSAGADPIRVYWFWRRTLLDPNTDAEQAVQASTILGLMERWYPALQRSRPPADEATGADLANPWDFLVTGQVPYSFSQEQQSQNHGKAVNWQRGLVGWVFSPEVPGRYGYVVGATDTRVCVVVEDDPRLKNKWNYTADQTLYVWVDRGAIHAPEAWHGNTAQLKRACTVESEERYREDTLRAQLHTPYYPGGRSR